MTRVSFAKVPYQAAPSLRPLHPLQRSLFPPTRSGNYTSACDVLLDLKSAALGVGHLARGATKLLFVSADTLDSSQAIGKAGDEPRDLRWRIHNVAMKLLFNGNNVLRNATNERRNHAAGFLSHIRPHSIIDIHRSSPSTSRELEYPRTADLRQV